MTEVRTSQCLVVIPTYNAQEFVERSIQSALKQSIPTQVWVVDNCSTDRTCEIVSRLEATAGGKIKLIQNEKNLGRIGNWNRCLELFEKSDFDYLKFLFMGDELLPRCIERLENLIQQEGALAVVVWPYYFKDLEGREFLSSEPLRASQKLTKEDLVFMGLFPGDFLGAIIGVLIGRHAVQGLRFDESMTGIVPFYDELVTRGSLYFLNEPLSRFNLDSHRTFFSSLTHYLVIESAYAKARALEKNKSWISTRDQKRTKERIMAQLVLDLVPYGRFSFWVSVAFRVMGRSTKTKVLNIIRQIAKRFRDFDGRQGL